MYGTLLGASTTTASALTLPNTGSNGAIRLVLVVSLVFGVLLMVANLAKLAAVKFFNS